MNRADLSLLKSVTARASSGAMVLESIRREPGWTELRERERESFEGIRGIVSEIQIASEEVGHDTRNNYIPEHGQGEMYGKKRFFLESCFSGVPQADSSETLVYFST